MDLTFSCLFQMIYLAIIWKVLTKGLITRAFLHYPNCISTTTMESGYLTSWEWTCSEVDRGSLIQYVKGGCLS